MSKKIMIVEDEPQLRDMIRSMMTYEGFVAQTAEDGQDFLDKIDDFQPDFVTLDVMMPGLSTWEILEKLKDKKACPNIVLLTAANLSSEEKQRLKQTGCVLGIIKKPFDMDELLETIKQLTER